MTTITASHRPNLVLVRGLVPRAVEFRAVRTLRLDAARMDVMRLKRALDCYDVHVERAWERMRLMCDAARGAGLDYVVCHNPKGYTGGEQVGCLVPFQLAGEELYSSGGWPDGLERRETPEWGSRLWRMMRWADTVWFRRCSIEGAMWALMGYRA